ncbi:MAG: hypothetical protein ACFFKA_05115 [Candidatus Thorarchaeota archaeon]
MVYIVIKTFYPSHKNEEVTQVYQEVFKKYPPDPSLSEHVVPVAGRGTEKGIESMNIQKLKKGAFDEVSKRIMGAMSMFHKVEGFEYSVEIWSTLEESLAAR